MNLLPKSHKEFGSAEFWENFFKKRGEKAFEWYGEYPELCGLLHKYVKPSDRVLNVGCGNSSLSADMYDVGYKSIVNVDISQVVIKQMADKYLATRPGMSYLQMDLLQMDFSDEEFAVVLDKGTLDAILTDESKETLDKVDQMFGEITRVLRVGGRYVCISLAQEHILRKVLQYFPQNGWMTRVCRVTDSDRDYERDFHMPLFVYVFTKFKKMANMRMILEVAPFDDKVERFDSVEKLTEAVKLMQNYGAVKQQLNKGTSDLDEHISLDLFSADNVAPRYTIHVVDSPRSLPNKFAAFIVPEGREVEWLFSTYEGRKELAKSACFQRLLVVTLHRGHTYNSIDDVKVELGGKVMELAPPDLGTKQVPYLSLGDDISQRVMRYRGSSELSGDFVVEDVEVDKDTFRRLVFMNNPTLVQSEAKLKKERSKKKSGKKLSKLVLDPDYLSCGYYSVMVSGFALLQDCDALMNKNSGSVVNVLLVGLGGGGLPIFLHRHFKQVSIDVVEIDNEMVNVAKNWFGFMEDERLKVHVGDGLKYIKDASSQGKHYHVVIIDVDNKDKSVGMNCPPEPFVKQEVLSQINRIIDPTGVLMVNMACRNRLLRNGTIDSLKSVFNLVLTKKLPEDINEVVFGFPSNRNAPLLGTEPFKKDGKLSEGLQRTVTGLQSQITEVDSDRSTVDLSEAIEGLSIS